MLKFLIFILSISLISFPVFSKNKMSKRKTERKHHKSKNKKISLKKTTAVSICERKVTVLKNSMVLNNNAIQAVIVAMETDSERNCKISGKNKADQYEKAGWNCIGLKGDNGFSCETKSAPSFAVYRGVQLDHLLFTNLNKHQALIAYINPNSYENCLADKNDVEASGVTDAFCVKR